MHNEELTIKCLQINPNRAKKNVSTITLLNFSSVSINQCGQFAFSFSNFIFIHISCLFCVNDNLCDLFIQNTFEKKTICKVNWINIGKLFPSIMLIFPHPLVKARTSIAQNTSSKLKSQMKEITKLLISTYESKVLIFSF